MVLSFAESVVADHRRKHSIAPPSRRIAKISTISHTTELRRFFFLLLRGTGLGVVRTPSSAPLIVSSGVSAGTLELLGTGVVSISAPIPFAGLGSVPAFIGGVVLELTCSVVSGAAGSVVDMIGCGDTEGVMEVSVNVVLVRVSVVGVIVVTEVIVADVAVKVVLVTVVSVTVVFVAFVVDVAVTVIVVSVVAVCDVPVTAVAVVVAAQQAATSALSTEERSQTSPSHSTASEPIRRVYPAGQSASVTADVFAPEPSLSPQLPYRRITKLAE